MIEESYNKEIHLKCTCGVRGRLLEDFENKTTCPNCGSTLIPYDELKDIRDWHSKELSRVRKLHDKLNLLDIFDEMYYTLTSGDVGLTVSLFDEVKEVEVLEDIDIFELIDEKKVMDFVVKEIDKERENYLKKLFYENK